MHRRTGIVVWFGVGNRLDRRHRHHRLRQQRDLHRVRPVSPLGCRRADQHRHRNTGRRYDRHQSGRQLGERCRLADTRKRTSASSRPMALLRQCPEPRSRTRSSSGNAGPSGASGVPPSSTLCRPRLVNATGRAPARPAASCGVASGTGDIVTTADLPDGASVNYTLTATISAGAVGTLANTVTVGAPVGFADPDPCRQLVDRHRHPDAICRPVDHQDRRCALSGAGHPDDVHAHRRQQRPVDGRWRADHRSAARGDRRRDLELQCARWRDLRYAPTDRVTFRCSPRCRWAVS